MSLNTSGNQKKLRETVVKTFSEAKGNTVGVNIHYTDTVTELT